MTDFTCIGILAHPLRPPTFPVAEKIAADVQQRGLETFLFTRWTVEDVQKVVAACDLVVAIGGDGAMLRAARVCAPHNVPVLGINMGQLGFLTEVRNPADWEHVIERILQQQHWIERRMMLHASVARDGETVVEDHALNDAVISGSIFGRMIQLETYIDSDWTTTYYADALVIASATGSTAYALAVGGPILPPELNNLLIVPAAPHLSMERPIVLSEGAKVEVKPIPFNRSDIVLSVDGTVITKLEPGDVVRVQASAYTSLFLRLRSRNYFYRSLLDRLEPRIRRQDN